MTERGIEKVERALKVENLYPGRDVQLVNHLIQALKAEALWKRDVDYVVADGEVKIVDEFTGRIMEGRRWSEGLHQAVEAKEGVEIMEENQTVATITLQNYFRLYEKLAGMTGTAKTEEKEFVEIYGLAVVPIPTNVDGPRRPQRPDLQDRRRQVQGRRRRHQGAPREGPAGARRHDRGRDLGDDLSELLKRQGVPHEVLNAKEHAARGRDHQGRGRMGAVTIATNMAGRGVDIKIGGDRRSRPSRRDAGGAAPDEVRELGGLYVLGTERHEARRIDNQLRGRSGRQGDPGETRFYLSGQDDLVRLFAGDRIFNIMDRFRASTTSRWRRRSSPTRSRTPRRRSRSRTSSSARTVVKYDDVMNEQRRVIYE